MSKKSFGIILTALLTVSGSAFADTFYFAAPPPGGVAWEGVYVNPYTANETSPLTINGLTIYCDDWDTEFSGNPTWNATVLAVTPGNVSNFKFGGATTTQSVSLLGTVGSYSLQYGTPVSTTAYDLYLEAVYLDQTMQGLGSNAQTQQEELSAAEWMLFTSSGASSLLSDINASGSAFADDVYTYLGDAHTALVSHDINPAGWSVITPVDNTFPMQEFLVDDSPGTLNGPNVPEPSAVILLGTVVGLLGWTKFRRRQA
jgi:hypothetical protein